MKDIYAHIDIDDTDYLDSLPFEKHADIMAEWGAKERSLAAAQRLSFAQLAASDMTFTEIEEKYGEETAINADIARDPDTFELDADSFARSRPTIEVHPEFIEARRRARAQGKKTPMIEHVSIPLDATLVRRLEKSAPNWKTRANDILRKTILSPLIAPTPTSPNCASKLASTVIKPHQAVRLGLRNT